MHTFNLSKTEFVAYLQCPLKYYIILSKNYGLLHGPRGERNYSSFPEGAQKGMKWHEWLKSFHEDYEESIMQGAPAPEGETEEDTRIMKYFYEFERERHQTEQPYWKPIAKECYLENEHYRGIIDRIDQLNEQGNYRVVEYKHNKGAYDEQELLFYAYLLHQEGDRIEALQPNARVKEIAVYYYETGFKSGREVSKEELVAFGRYLETVKEEMAQGNYVRRQGCTGMKCNYQPLCERIPEGLLQK